MNIVFAGGTAYDDAIIRIKINEEIDGETVNVTVSGKEYLNVDIHNGLIEFPTVGQVFSVIGDYQVIVNMAVTLTSLMPH